jgi:hypothetical protein
MLNIATEPLNDHFGQDIELQKPESDLYFGIFSNLFLYPGDNSDHSIDAA